MKSMFPYTLFYIFCALYISAWYIPSYWLEITPVFADTLSPLPALITYDAGTDADIEQYEPSRRDIMIQEIKIVFTTYLNKWNTPKNDPRWKKITQYAEWLADIIIIYQEHPLEHIDGLWLPKVRSTHLILATMVTIESTLNSRRVGKSRGEVGLMQCHSRCLNGHSSKEVRNNPKLGLELGVRWFTLSIRDATSKYKLKDSYIWKDNDWICPVTIYCSGHKYFIKRKKKCTMSLFATRRRIKAMKKYRTTIDKTRH